MLYKKTIIFILLFSINLSFFNLEHFKGYSSKNKQAKYSVVSLMQSKYISDKRWNENYFHEAQFPEQGITVFTNIIFTNSLFEKKGCKLNCIVTFKDNTKYVFNKNYERDEIIAKKEGFSIKFKENFIELKGNNYKVHIEDENFNLNLNYEIVNPPHIFGDGIITINSRNFLAFCQPIVGAYVKGNMYYQGENIKLNGRGSVNHDYNVIAPIKTPRQWRSFWLYDDHYSIVIHTFILLDKTQIDRVIIYKDNKLLKSFLNTGLETNNNIYDKKTKFNYPSYYSISHKDNLGDEIKANINLKSITDKIQVFEHLSPVIHSVVSLAVGELYNYRFWSNAYIKLKINNNYEVIKINGIGCYVDSAK